MYSLEPQSHGPGGPRRQRGVSLIELLVGLTVGLLVIAAALGTLALSRGASAAVSEISQLQQQGAYALRIIGMQLREAGSLEPHRRDADGLYEFPTPPADATGTSAIEAAVRGTDGRGAASDSVSVFTPYADSAAEHLRDCLGNRLRSTGAIDTTFAADGAGQLTCASQGRKDAVISHVADFQLSYRVRTGSGLQILNATEVEASRLWAAVEAIEVCLDLQGSETIAGAAAPYQDCNGTDRPRNGRTHLVFRNVFDLRLQGL